MWWCGLCGCDVVVRCWLAYHALICSSARAATSEDAGGTSWLSRLGWGGRSSSSSSLFSWSGQFFHPRALGGGWATSGGVASLAMSAEGTGVVPIHADRVTVELEVARHNIAH